MAAKRSSRLRFAQTAAYKMSRSVSRVLLSYGHLSRRTVAGTLQPPRERPGKPNAPISVLLRIEFTAADAFTRRRVSSYLAFPPLPADAQTPSRRYISVALFLKSPSAGVTRYPRPMEPGLSSRTGFRHVPATVRRTRRLYCSEAPPESQRKIQRIRKGEASVTMPPPSLSLTLSPACRCTSAKTVHCR